MTFDSIDFLERAVAVPSHEDPGEMRDLLVDELDAHDVAARIDDAGNTIAERGAGDPHVVLNTHIDTVPPHVPLNRDDDVIRGRGACDAKGPLAAMLAAFLAPNPPCSITLAITPDEETASSGAAALSVDADAFIVGEPTGLDVCNAARGRFEATISLGGENAHAAEAWKGVNAVAAAEAALAALRSFDDERGPGEHEALGSASLTPTVIRGGETANQVPNACEITVDRRSVPPESADGFRSALEDHIRAHVPDDVSVSVTLADRGTPFLEAWSTPADDPLVRALAASSGGAIRPFTAATEAAYFAATAPTVVFGPGDLVDDDGPVAHADREYVRVPAVEAAGTAIRETLDRLATG